MALLIQIESQIDPDPTGSKVCFETLNHAIITNCNSPIPTAQLARLLTQPAIPDALNALKNLKLSPKNEDIVVRNTPNLKNKLTFPVKIGHFDDYEALDSIEKFHSSNFTNENNSIDIKSGAFSPKDDEIGPGNTELSQKNSPCDMENENVHLVNSRFGILKTVNAIKEFENAHFPAESLHFKNVFDQSCNLPLQNSELGAGIHNFPPNDSEIDFPRSLNFPENPKSPNDDDSAAEICNFSSQYGKLEPSKTLNSINKWKNSNSLRIENDGLKSDFSCEADSVALILPCLIELCKDEDTGVREVILHTVGACLPYFDKGV